MAEASTGEDLPAGTRVEIADRAWRKFCKGRGISSPNPGVRRVILVSREGTYRLDMPLWWWERSDLKVVP